MDNDEAKRLIAALDKRVEACETMAGLRKKDSAPASEPCAGSPPPPTVAGSPQPVAEGAADVSTRVPLVLQVCRLRNGANKLLEGSLQEFVDRYDEVRVWLESEASSVSALLADIEAKRTFILEHEDKLKKTAADLRNLEDLRGYVNPRPLEGLEQFRGRLEALEANGAVISEKALQLNNRLRELTMKYSTTMNMVATLFCEWSEAIAACDMSRSRRPATAQS